MFSLDMIKTMARAYMPSLNEKLKAKKEIIINAEEAEKFLNDFGIDCKLEIVENNLKVIYDKKVWFNHGHWTWYFA